MLYAFQTLAKLKNHIGKQIFTLFKLFFTYFTFDILENMNVNVKKQCQKWIECRINNHLLIIILTNCYHCLSFCHFFPFGLALLLQNTLS